MTLPDEVDWFVHRVLSSEHYHLTYRDLAEEMSIDDLYDVHCVLDAISAAESFAAAASNPRGR